MSFEYSAEPSVVVANEIFWGAVPWKRFRDLARQPVGRRIAGHRKPQQPSPLVAENQKCEQPDSVWKPKSWYCGIRLVFASLGRRGCNGFALRWFSRR